MYVVFLFFFFKQKTAYEMRISDWSSDVCSSDLHLMHRSLVRPCRRDGPAAVLRRRPMAAIGFVNGTIEKGFVGQLKTLSIRAAIEIRTNRSKSSDVQPDYRGWSEGVEIGDGWIRVGQQSGESYSSLSLDAPEIGPTRL